MAVMQLTYDYWGALIFGYLENPNAAATDYIFQMQVDNAARLWVDGTLVIDATCMSPVQHRTIV